MKKTMLRAAAATFMAIMIGRFLSNQIAMKYSRTVSATRTASTTRPTAAGLRRILVSSRLLMSHLQDGVRRRARNAVVVGAADDARRRREVLHRRRRARLPLPRGAPPGGRTP